MSNEARDAVMNCQSLTDMKLRYCLLMIADRSTSNRDGPYYSFPGQVDIAKRCARSVRTVEGWIRKLVELQYLTRVRRQDGMGYFINLSTVGTLIEAPSADMIADGRLDPTRNHVHGSDPQVSISDPQVSISDPQVFENIKGIELRENIQRTRESAKTYPQNDDEQTEMAQPDRDSRDRWDELVQRVENRELLKPHLIPTLRNARLELYRERGLAFVICSASPDWFRATFDAIIAALLPRVTQLAGWEIITLSQGELRRIEREAGKHGEENAGMLQESRADSASVEVVSR